jgi:hypothetical protein
LGVVKRVVSRSSISHIPKRFVLSVDDDTAFRSRCDDVSEWSLFLHWNIAFFLRHPRMVSLETLF